MGAIAHAFVIHLQAHVRKRDTHSTYIGISKKKKYNEKEELKIDRTHVVIHVHPTYLLPTYVYIPLSSTTVPSAQLNSTPYIYIFTSTIFLFNIFHKQ